MNIKDIKRKLLVKYPYFGSVIANTEFIVNDSVEIAMTDEKNIYYNNKYLDNLSEKEKLFIFAHEICHIAFNHINRRKDKNKEIWNIATDAVINSFLEKDGLTLIKGCIYIKDAYLYDAEELYNILLNKNKEESNDIKEDIHSSWDVSLNNDNSEDVSEKEMFNQNRIEKKKQLENMKNSLINNIYNSSNNSKNIDIRNIGINKPLVEWRRLLKESINYEVDWSYKDAYIEDGVLTPYLEDVSCSVTEILLDTSGSVDEMLLRNFLIECKNILKVSRIKVGCFDTQFYGFNEIKNEEDIEKLEFKGGGGTDFDIAVRSFTRGIENKIIFTDGESNMPNIYCDVIWIVFGNKNINPKGGKVIYIDSSELKNKNITLKKHNL